MIIMRRATILLVTLALTEISHAQAPAATAPPNTQAPATATVSTPANWPTVQFASSKDHSVSKACDLLNQMIRALGGDADMPNQIPLPKPPRMWRRTYLRKLEEWAAAKERSDAAWSEAARRFLGKHST